MRRVVVRRGPLTSDLGARLREHALANIEDVSRAGVVAREAHVDEDIVQKRLEIDVLRLYPDG